MSSTFFCRYRSSAYYKGDAANARNQGEETSGHFEGHRPMFHAMPVEGDDDTWEGSLSPVSLLDFIRVGLYIRYVCPDTATYRVGMSARLSTGSRDYLCLPYRSPRTFHPLHGPNC